MGSLFKGLLNVASFTLLQVLVYNLLGPNCFVYIGSILFLDWSKKNNFLHIILALLVGIYFDVANHTLGVHTLSLVTLAYVKHYILMVLIPGFKRDDEIEITIFKLGLNRIVIYTVLLIIVYYSLVFVLYLCKDIHFVSNFFKNIFSTLLILLFCQLILMLLDLIGDER